ncbi:MAG: hypothetical protein WC801_06735 [Patescibacteria group bacterium]|jgi:hypothetical protein
MSVIPCKQNKELREKIVEFSEVLKTQSHKLNTAGLSEQEFYQSGLFRGAIERIRGQFSATMGEKRDFAASNLNHMEDQKYISGWESAGEANRHDYSVQLLNGKTAVIELKGCLDGNNTNIFERPPHAEEFILWSVCTNPGADPPHNVWSGIHTRLSAEIISRQQRVDGLIVWDMICGTLGRPCPKLEKTRKDGTKRLTTVGPYSLPPPCIYLFPATIPSPRNNPKPAPQTIADVGLLKAFHECFGGLDEELNQVEIKAENVGPDLVRTTTITRGGQVEQQSTGTAIRRA